MGRSPGIEAFEVDSRSGDDLLPEFQVFPQGLDHCQKNTNWTTVHLKCLYGLTAI